MAVHTMKFVQFINQLEDRTLADGILRWFNRNLSRKSVEKYEGPVMIFLKYAEAKMKRQPLRTDINLKLVNGWIGHRDEQISRRSLAGEFSTLRNLFRFLSEGPEKIFTESPLTGAMVSKRNYPAKPTPVLSDSQIQALAEYLENEKNRWSSRNKRVSYRKARYNELLITVFLSTGLTVSSLVDLKISDFNNEPGNYFLKEFRSKNQTHIEKQLTQRVGDMLAGFLSDYRQFAKAEDFMFPAKNGSGASAQNISNHVAYVISKSGVSPDQIRTHSLRSTYAIQLFFKGLPLLAVKEKMGHRDISTTMIYLQLASSDSLDAKLDPMAPETPGMFRESILHHPL